MYRLDRSITHDLGLRHQATDFSITNNFRQEAINTHIAVFEHPGNTILDTELAAIRIFRLRIIDQKISDLID